MKKIFFCLLLLNFQNLNAQTLEWFEGSLVLSNGDVLTGKTSIAPEHDLILFQQGESRMVYPAHRIQSLYFYDKASNINRRYISLTKFHSGRPSYQLYEVIIKGEVSVVRRKKENTFSVHADALDFNYFILYNNALTPLRKFKKKIFPQLLTSSGNRLEEFISINRLIANHAANTLTIIEFYNGLIKTEGSLARN